MTTENSTLLTVSEAASGKLKEILEEQGTPDAFLRITLAPGGHGGAQYILGLEDFADDDDTVIDAGGVRVLVDADSAPLIEGTNIDYVDGFQRSGFVISNPNIQQSGCGCGASGGGCGGGGGGGGCGCGGGGPEAEGGHDHGGSPEAEGSGGSPEAEGSGGGCACGGH